MYWRSLENDVRGVQLLYHTQSIRRFISAFPFFVTNLIEDTWTCRKAWTRSDDHTRFTPEKMGKRSADKGATWAP